MTESLLNLLLIQLNLILLVVLVTTLRLLLRKGALIALGAVAALIALLPAILSSLR